MKPKKKPELADPTRHVHKLWHAFQKKFLSGDSDLNAEQTWKWLGYGLMTRFDTWAKHHPTVQSITVSDSDFSTSRLYLIPHETPDYYMGTTVIFVSQRPTTPAIFFLYGRNHKVMMYALAATRKRVYRKKGWR